MNSNLHQIEKQILSIRQMLCPMPERLTPAGIAITTLLAAAERIAGEQDVDGAVLEVSKAVETVMYG